MTTSITRLVLCGEPVKYPDSTNAALSRRDSGERPTLASNSSEAASLVAAFDEWVPRTLTVLRIDRIMRSRGLARFRSKCSRGPAPRSARLHDCSGAYITVYDTEHYGILRQDR